MLKITCLLLLITASYSGTVASQDTLRLMANTSPPYSDKTLPEQGLALEIVNHVFAATPYKPDITIDNWSRAVEGASLGVYDGLAAAWYSDA